MDMKKHVKRLNAQEIPLDMFFDLVVAQGEFFKDKGLDDGGPPYNTELMMFAAQWLAHNYKKKRPTFFGMAVMNRMLAFLQIINSLPSHLVKPVGNPREALISESAIKAGAIARLIHDPASGNYEIAFDQDDFLEHANRLHLELADKEEFAKA